MSSRITSTVHGPRIGLRPLTQLLRRVGTSYRSGVDARRIWDLEAKSGPRAQRPAFAAVHEHISTGDSLAESLRSCRGVFPPLVVEMVELGEHTGKLDAVLLRLADHYEHMLELRRNFLIGIAWPGVQLGMCVLIVGFLIWIFGWLSERNAGETLDPLGLGLVGNTGLAIYFGGVLFIAACFVFVAMAFLQGWLGSTVNRVIIHLPVVGQCLRLNALARMTWTLSLALESGSDARRALRMSLRSAQLPYYTEVQPHADTVIERGGEFHEALRSTNRFPDDFVLSLASAEHAGAVTESLDVMSRDYSERARMANRILTTAATFAIWIGVAALVVFLIFRLFFFYLGMINDALNFK
ncbi:MAG: type II secretion system F family protein [Pirellulales bacterium]